MGEWELNHNLQVGNTPLYHPPHFKNSFLYGNIFCCFEGGRSILWKPNLEGLLKNSMGRAMLIFSFLRGFLHGELIFLCIFFFFGSWVCKIVYKFCVQICVYEF